jgi:hypothetical protein
MLKRKGIQLFLTVLSIFLFSSETSAQWTLSYGWADSRFSYKGMYSACLTSDLGIVTAGFEGADMMPSGLLLIKYFPNGVSSWSRLYPGVGAGKAIIQTAEQGYAVCGSREVIKIDLIGNVQWRKYCENNIDFKSIVQTKDGGYMIAGSVAAVGGFPDFDAYLIKLDKQGNIVWQNTYGGGGKEAFNSIKETTDGGFLAVGYCTSITTHGKEDFWVVKINSIGEIEWQYGYGGSDSEIAYSIKSLEDGGFIILGKGFTTTWIIKINSLGEIVWQKKDQILDQPFSCENSIVVRKGQFVIVKPRTFNFDNMFWCTGLSIIELNENLEVIKQRNIVPNADLVGGIQMSYSSIYENEFGGYYIVSNPGQRGRPPATGYYLDNMGEGVFVTPDVEYSETISLREQTSILPIKSELVYTGLTATYVHGGGSPPVPSWSAEYSVSPNVLDFGNEYLGEKTQSQRFKIENKNAVLADWAIGSNVSWIKTDKTRGQGNAVIIVSVDPSGLFEGEHTGTIYVVSQNSIVTPQTLEIKINVYGSGQTYPPFGGFDTPRDFTNAMGSTPVTGWALDDIEATGVKIYRDPVGSEPTQLNGLVYIGDAIFVEGARPDVEAIYSNYPLKSRAGWGYMMLTNFLPNGGNGTFNLHAIATDKEGHVISLGKRTILCDNANAVLPIGAIDTPTQGGFATGPAFVNFGWALTPLPKSIQIDGSTITVWVDGLPIGHPKYNNYRADIAALFPGYANSNGAVGYYHLDTTGFENKIHTISWSVEDSLGAIDGIGSRYFQILNTASGSQLSGEETRFAGKPYEPAMSIEQLKITSTDIANPVYIRLGYNFDRPAETIYPDRGGSIRVSIPELERVSIFFNPIQLWETKEELEARGQSFLNNTMATGSNAERNKPDYSGYLVVGTELRPLPIGATFDSDRSILYWQPGPGFLGDYNFIFVDRIQNVKKVIKIRIGPK